MCCMLPSGGEDWELCYRKGLVDEPPEGNDPAGAPAMKGLLDMPGTAMGCPKGVIEGLL